MKRIITPVAIIFVAATLLISCQKEMETPLQWEGISKEAKVSEGHGHLTQTKTFDSEVAIKWMDMQLRLTRTNPTPLGGLPPQRYFGYSAIALYESVVPGMPAYQSLSGQLTDMPAMPETLPGYAYYWPAAGNAALAAMTRSFFTSATAFNKASVDSLENALNTAYLTETDAEEVQRSAEFGKAVAQLVFGWSLTDRASGANAPYTPPTGPGLWEPTPPAFAAAWGPYWKDNRLLVASSYDGADLPAPPAYSEVPGSEFYQMVKEVYDISQLLTPDQKALAVYYRDNPGFGGGHYFSTLKQILAQENPSLDFTAYAFAKTSIAIIDAGIGCYKSKYQYNLMRPIKYIREVLGHGTWNPVFGTPNFPDYPSAHSTIAGAFGEIMTGLFGSNYQFTDHSYDYLGMPSRYYASFDAMVKEISDSRVFAGIHYRLSCDKGEEQGKKIGQNINATVKFLK